MKLTDTSTPYKPNTINIRCPKCSKEGAFGGAGVDDVAWSNEQAKVGIRRCPNTECHEGIFVESDAQQQLTKTYPAEILDFDDSNLPGPISASLQEAIQCHGIQCFKATAIMVRRTLEELCADKKAEGKNLQERISALSSTILVPAELLQAAQDIRLLGNDAAHLEARVYDEIGEEEVEVAIELTKELLKAVYQYGSLVDRLKALKKENDTGAEPA